VDFLIKKEIDNLKKDIASKDVAIEADKYAFETRLLNGLGEEIKEYLQNPPRANLFTKWKNKFLRWRQIRNDKKIIKKGGF
jgi:hypothetical protein